MTRSWVFGWSLLAVLCCSGVPVYAKTAAEFTVTVDTENFKEIRIPFRLWAKIITRNYDPDGKLPFVTNITEEEGNYYVVPQAPGMSSPILHEVVLNVIVPPEAEEPNVDLEVDTQDVIAPVLNEEPADAVVEAVQAAPQVVQAAPQVVQAASQVVQSLPQAVQAIQASPLSPQATPLAQSSDAASSPGSVLVQTARFPCTCDKGICGCCTSFFSQKGCADIGFLPDEFAFEVKMTMNGNVLAKRKLPVSDPPPICFNPRRAPFLELCAQLNNIHFKNRNVHVCVDLDANVGGFELFSWNYNCLKFGTGGLVTGLNPQKAKKPTSKPQEGGLFDLFGGGGDADGDDDEDEGGFLDGILGDDY